MKIYMKKRETRFLSHRRPGAHVQPVKTRWHLWDGKRAPPFFIYIFSDLTESVTSQWSLLSVCWFVVWSVFHNLISVQLFWMEYDSMLVPLPEYNIWSDFVKLTYRVLDPDLVGSTVFTWSGSGSGSDFHFFSGSWSRCKKRVQKGL